MDLNLKTKNKSKQEEVLITGIDPYMKKDDLVDLESENRKQSKVSRLKKTTKEESLTRDENILEDQDSKIADKRRVTNTQKSYDSDQKIFSKDETIRQIEENYKKKIKELESNLALLNDENQNLKNLKEEKEKEITDRDKKINFITLANNKLMQNLEDLKKQVDERFDKVNFKKVTDKMKYAEEEKKQTSIENLLKIKEKELRNSSQMIEFLRKNNEMLQKTVDNYTDYKNIFKVQDKLTLREKEIMDLQLEIKALNKTIEEHKKCMNEKSQLLNEIKILKDDLKLFKENNKELNFKLKEEEKRHDRIRNKYFSVTREIENKKINTVVDQITSNLGSNQMNDMNKINALNHDINLTNVLTDKNIAKEEVEKLKTAVPKKKLSELKLTKQMKNAGSKRNLEEKQNKLNLQIFTNNERDELTKNLSEEQIIKIERKFEALENSRNSIENKHKTDVKILTKKISQLEEKLEFLNSQIKESEQRNKIFQFQVNEYKNEQRVYQKKLNETQLSIEQLTNTLKEKEQENKILTKQIESMRKVIKHNALPPIDENIKNHLDKIKKEEMEQKQQADNKIIEDDMSLNETFPNNKYEEYENNQDEEEGENEDEY